MSVCFVSGVVTAQTIWNAEHLAKVKEQIKQPVYNTAYRQLIKDADKALKKEPLSVMMKDKVAASGDKHDYLSQARYYWRDPSKPDGKPYINKDGESNPEINRLDRVRLANMAGNVTTLSLAYYFSGEEKYAEKAAEQLRVWFLDKETKMNPNLNYAQIVPGKNGDKGRCFGVIDTYSFIGMLDAVQLLEKSAAFTPADSERLKGSVHRRAERGGVRRTGGDGERCPERLLSKAHINADRAGWQAAAGTETNARLSLQPV